MVFTVFTPAQFQIMKTKLNLKDHDEPVTTFADTVYLDLKKQYPNGDFTQQQVQTALYGILRTQSLRAARVKKAEPAYDQAQSLMREYVNGTVTAKVFAAKAEEAGIQYKNTQVQDLLTRATEKPIHATPSVVTLSTNTQAGSSRSAPALPLFSPDIAEHRKIFHNFNVQVGDTSALRRFLVDEERLVTLELNKHSSQDRREQVAYNSLSMLVPRLAASRGITNHVDPLNGKSAYVYTEDHFKHDFEVWKNKGHRDTQSLGPRLRDEALAASFGDHTMAVAHYDGDRRVHRAFFDVAQGHQNGCYSAARQDGQPVNHVQVAKEIDRQAVLHNVVQLHQGSKGDGYHAEHSINDHASWDAVQHRLEWLEKQFTQHKDPDYAQIAASVVKDAQSLHLGHLVEFKYTNRPFGQFTQADVRYIHEQLELKRLHAQASSSASNVSGAEGKRRAEAVL